jgi:hypothetical protein
MRENYSIIIFGVVFILSLLVFKIKFANKNFFQIKTREVNFNQNVILLATLPLLAAINFQFTQELIILTVISSLILYKVVIKWKV